MIRIKILGCLSRSRIYEYQYLQENSEALCYRCGTGKCKTVHNSRWIFGSLSKCMTKSPPQMVTRILTLCNPVENVMCIKANRKNHTTPSTSLKRPIVNLIDFSSSDLKMTQTGVIALLGFPVSYINFVLNHQLSSFLKIFLSYFLNCCAKGFRYCWLLSF